MSYQNHYYFYQLDNNALPCLKQLNQLIMADDIESIQSLINQSNSKELEAITNAVINPEICHSGCIQAMALIRAYEESTFFSPSFNAKAKKPRINLSSLLAFYNDPETILTIQGHSDYKDQDLQSWFLLSLALFYDNIDLFDIGNFSILNNKNYLNGFEGFDKKADFIDQFNFSKNNQIFHFNILKSYLPDYMDQLLIQYNVYPETVIQQRILPCIDQHKKHKPSKNNNMFEMLAFYYQDIPTFHYIMTHKYQKANERAHQMMDLCLKIINYNLNPELVYQLHQINKMDYKNNKHLCLGVFNQLDTSWKINQLLGNENIKNELIEALHNRKGQSFYNVIPESVEFHIQHNPQFSLEQLAKNMSKLINKNYIDQFQLKVTLKDNNFNNISNTLVYLFQYYPEYYQGLTQNSQILQDFQKKDSSFYNQFENDVLSLYKQNHGHSKKQLL